jgi:outer membrane cobalamin receptor
MRLSAFGLALGVVTLCTACARGGNTAGSLQVSLISRADIERVHARTALDAVQRFRSDILVARAPSSVLLQKRTYPVVFMNDQFLGQVDELRHIPADGIEEIHILSGTDATTKFGSQYGGGVIQIIARVS